MNPPLVSVIVPVYNCRATLGEALGSVFEQTIDPGLVEVIAVDDGSTDGSGDELDRLAEGRPGFSVVRRPNSGGPGAPRNAGIERARGRYLFFLDADDRLGPEALERMCAVAEEQGTDVVVGRYVGIGRGVAQFTKNIARVDVDDPDTDVYGASLTTHKLFRRELLERHGIRFPEGILAAEDKVFTAHAFLHSSGVSVVADHDCYYLVEREDGSSIMQAGGGWPEVFHGEVARSMLEQVMAHRGPGPARDRMLVRHFELEVLYGLDRRLLTAPEDVVDRVMDGMRRLCEDFLTPSVMMRMRPRYRVLAHSVRSGRRELLMRIIERAAASEPVPLLVDKARAYVAYPGFREPGASVPDTYFDVTDRLRVRRSLTALGWDGDRLGLGGTAVVSRLDPADRTIALLLRDKRSGGEHRVPCEAGGVGEDGDGGGDGEGGFTAALDPATAASGSPLPAGTWDLHVEVAHDRLVKEGRLGADRAEGVTAPKPRFVVSGGGVGASVTPFFTQGYDNLSLTVVPGPAALEKLLRVEAVGWDGLPRLLVRGSVPVSPASAAHVGVAVRLEARGGGDTKDAEVRLLPGAERLEFTAVTDLRGLAVGRWDVHLEFTVGGETARMRVPVRAGQPKVPPVPCATLGLRRASFYRTGGGNLAVHIVPGRVTALARSAGRRLTRR
ncbi:glycosyltransferase family 2 protein [Actinomadura litoris]|uniref:glycosyltransferase family 2 protein n=1 Tax=Actinomadura litoris TaxID=2678616 RepID=UPI0027E182A9|nr:glycosyltransferase family 2 protein [Actinomadura litoris]